MKTWTLYLSATLFLWNNGGAFGADLGDICSSPHLKTIIAAVECKRDACNDPAIVVENIYPRACTEIEPDPQLTPNTRVPSTDTLNTAFHRVNESYALIEVAEVTRLDHPIKSRVLPPCECLDRIEARIHCGIERCKAAEVPTGTTGGEKIPTTEDQNQEKAITPTKNDPAQKDSGSCSLISSGGTFGLLELALLLLGPIAWIRRRP